MLGLTTANWIAIVAVVVSAIGVSVTSANFLVGQRERARAASGKRARVRAVINEKVYPEGWRSVQLHIVPIDDGGTQAFQYEKWWIEKASLVGPRTAILARAKDDDYASEIFYPETPLRTLDGKSEGLGQRFALEFFIKVPTDQIGKVVFRITYSGKNLRRSTQKVVAEVNG